MSHEAVPLDSALEQILRRVCNNMAMSFAHTELFVETVRKDPEYAQLSLILPSRFQIGEEIIAGEIRGQITAITYDHDVVMDLGELGEHVGAKVIYTLKDRKGVKHTCSSNDAMRVAPTLRSVG